MPYISQIQMGQTLVARKSAVSDDCYIIGHRDAAGRYFFALNRDHISLFSCPVSVRSDDHCSRGCRIRRRGDVHDHGGRSGHPGRK